MTMINKHSIFFYFLLFLQIRADKEHMMKAVFIEEVNSAHVIRVRRVPVPKPGVNQVLVDVISAAVCPIDEYMKNNETYYDGPPVPSIPGKEISGIVVEWHPSVKGVNGRTVKEQYERVFCSVTSGGYAEFAVANASSCYVLKREFSFEQGATLYESYFNAHKALIAKANVKRNETVLIHGARGGLGVGLIQIAKSVGATVVASVIDNSTEHAMKTAGADYTVRFNKRKYIETALSKIHEKQRTFDIIFEFKTFANLENKTRNPLAAGGRIVVIHGDKSSTVTPEELKASNGTIINFHLNEFTEDEKKLAAKFVLDAVDSGDINPVIGNEYSLDDAVEAEEDITKSTARAGKFLFYCF